MVKVGNIKNVIHLGLNIIFYATWYLISETTDLDLQELLASTSNWVEPFQRVTFVTSTQMLFETLISALNLKSLRNITMT